MPRLPTVVDSMGARPIPQNGVRVVGYTAGQEGQALAGVGKQLGKDADELYAKNQRDALSEAQAAAAELNDFASKSLFDPENGALTKNGVDAANISTQYGESFARQRDLIRSRLSNPQALRAFDADAQSRLTQFNEALNRHQVQQTELVNKGNNQALIESEINASALMYNGPESISTNVGRISDAVAAQGRADGAGDVAIGVAISKAQSAAYASGITQRALTDPIAAMADLQQVRARLTAEDLSSVESKLRPLAEAQQAIELAQRAIGGTQTGSAAAAPVTVYSPEVNSAIQTAAQKHGVDANTLVQIARLESGGNPMAANASGAAGLFQLMPGVARQYGVTNVNDAGQSADAAARLVKDNQAALRSALGREPTPGEIYLAHQQGADGAKALLRNPTMNVVDALEIAYDGDRRKAEAAVMQNGGDTSMTAGQFAGLWVGKVSGNGQPQAAAPSSYEDFLKAANGNVRVATQAMSHVREAQRAQAEAQKENERAVVNDTYAFINANGREALFNTQQGRQLQIRLQEAKPELLDKFMNEDKQSDPAVYQRVLSGVANGQDVNVLDFTDSLSREHIFSLIKMQQDMADPAKAEGHRTITQMVSDMKPIILGGKEATSQEGSARIERFRSQFQQQYELVRRDENGGKPLSVEQMNRVAYGLLAKRDTGGGMFGGGSEPTFNVPFGTNAANLPILGISDSGRYVSGQTGQDVSPVFERRFDDRMTWLPENVRSMAGNVQFVMKPEVAGSFLGGTAPNMDNVVDRSVARQRISMTYDEVVAKASRDIAAKGFIPDKDNISVYIAEAVKRGIFTVKAN